MSIRVEIVGHVDPNDPDKVIYESNIKDITPVVSKKKARTIDDIALGIIDSVWSLKYGSPRGVYGIALNRPLPPDVLRKLTVLNSVQSPFKGYKTQAFLYPTGSTYAGSGVVALMKEYDRLPGTAIARGRPEKNWRPIAWSSAVFTPDMAKSVMGQVDDSIKDIFDEPHLGRHIQAREIAERSAKRRVLIPEPEPILEEVEPLVVLPPDESMEELFKRRRTERLTKAAGVFHKAARSPRRWREHAQVPEDILEDVPTETVEILDPRTGDIIRYTGVLKMGPTTEEIARRRAEAQMAAERTTLTIKPTAKPIAVAMDVDAAVGFWMNKFKEERPIVSEAGRMIKDWVDKSEGAAKAKRLTVYNRVMKEAMSLRLPVKPVPVQIEPIEEIPVLSWPETAYLPAAPGEK